MNCIIPGLNLKGEILKYSGYIYVNTDFVFSICKSFTCIGQSW